MRRLSILFLEAGALLGISASVSTLSNGDIETIMAIIAQALVIVYTIIKLLQTKPVDIKELIRKLYELLTLILRAFKVIGTKSVGVFKRKKKKQNEEEEENVI